MRVALYCIVAAQALGGFVAHLTGVLLLFLTQENAGFDYTTAVMLYGVYGVLVAVAGMTLSPILDRAPAFRVAIIAAVMAALVRVALPILTPPLMAGALVGVMPIVDALCALPQMLALKRILRIIHVGKRDEEADRDQEFLIAVSYALTNAADVVANLVYDAMRQWLPTLAAANMAASWTAAGGLLGVAILLLIAKRYALNADMPVHPMDYAYGATPIRATCRDGRFWRYMTLATLFFFVRMVFRHLETTLPMYLVRTFGPMAHFPLIQAINPALICVLTPFMPRALRSVDVSLYDSFTMGTAVSMSGPLVLGLSLAAGGNTLAAVAAFVAIFSVGESIWSPRFVHYALQVAPTGSEAMYVALANLPSLLVKLPTSWFSAWLVEAFCPVGSCDGVALWLIIGLVAAGTPFGLWALRRWLDTMKKRRPRRIR